MLILGEIEIHFEPFIWGKNLTFDSTSDAEGFVGAGVPVRVHADGEYVGLCENEGDLEEILTALDIFGIVWYNGGRDTCLGGFHWFC